MHTQIATPIDSNTRSEHKYSILHVHVYITFYVKYNTIYMYLHWVNFNWHNVGMQHVKERGIQFRWFFKTCKRHTAKIKPNHRNKVEKKIRWLFSILWVTGCPFWHLSIVVQIFMLHPYHVGAILQGYAYMQLNLSSKLWLILRPFLQCITYFFTYYSSTHTNLSIMIHLSIMQRIASAFWPLTKVVGT